MKTHWHQALVVTNNLVHRSIVEFNIAKFGFEVTMVKDVHEAFLLAEKQPFDLIFTDFQMPDGTGVDLARKLRYLDLHAKTPMVLIADEHADLDLKFVRDFLWMLVVREPCDLAKVVEKVGGHFLPAETCC